MRFKEFVHEEYQSPATIAETIIKDCRKFLDESGFEPTNYVATGTWRGLESNIHGGNNRSLLKFSQRDNREPVSSCTALHKTMDDALKELTGVQFRSCAAFSTRKDMAKEYGSPYLMFPIGDYKYCWSPVVDDAYTYFDTVGRPSEEELEDVFAKINSPVTGYKTTDLKDAIMSGNEIMIIGDYYLLQYQDALRKMTFTFAAVMDELGRKL